MKPTENGLILEGIQEFQAARTGVHLLPDEYTGQHLDSVHRRVMSELHETAKDSITDAEMRDVQLVALALGERYAREDDLRSDLAYEKIAQLKPTAEFLVEGSYAEVVIAGLEKLIRANFVKLALHGVSRKGLGRMLESLNEI